MQRGLAAATLLLLVGGGWLGFETLRLREQIRQNEADRIALQQRERALQAEIAQQQSNRAELDAKLREVKEERARLDQEREGLHQSEPKFAFLLLTRSVRGGGDAKELNIAPATETVKLRLEFESDDYPSYRAELLTQPGDQLVWRNNKLKTRAKDGTKIIDLSLRADLFQSQRYQLNLKAVTASGEIEDLPSYSFKVVKK
jgi:cell division protein FtsB